MTAFQRLSTVPTIPELLRQDRTHRGAHAVPVRPPWRTPMPRAGGRIGPALHPKWIWRLRMEACFAGAYALPAAARILGKCGLLSPAGIGACFAGTERLAQAGMSAWHVSRCRPGERTCDEPPARAR